ncbi:collagen alpha-2(IX) chain-like [Sinocyclocheilus grahami]|uniref:collagen alpha-2(IX) chain-like n=1 Tax=Sinocyclocheilus grahami TaxID=75366 RepID=UPI0007AD5B2C|nr:PREDICTED: collagen alpha-2(IX) chain-like [Sinocyclocheilus grahami]
MRIGLSNQQLYPHRTPRSQRISWKSRKTGAKGLKGQRGEPVIGLPGHDGHQDLRGLPSHPAEPKDGIDGLRGPCGFPRPVDQPGMVGDAGIPGMCEARDCSIHAPVVRKEMGLVKGPLS